MNDIEKYKLQEMAIAFVDDHEMVLEGFKSYMQKKGLNMVEAFSTGHELLSRMENRVFDIYIADVELPDMEVTCLIDLIREKHPEAKIIIHTIHEEMWVVNKITEKKVDGVVYKSAHLEQLLEAIVAVANSSQYYCPQFRKSQKRLYLQNDIPSVRETEVLKNIAKGLSTKEIAARLFISENTVENHRKNLFRKLHSHNMAELIVKAIAAGYINPEETI